MSRTLRLHPGAVVDVIDVYDHYEREKPDLGKRFLHSLEQTYRTITDHPAQYGRYWRNWRAVLVKKFPYKVMYRIDGKFVFVVSVIHARRSDRIWKSRV